MKKKTIRNLKILSVASLLGASILVTSHSEDIKLYLKFNHLTENLFEGTRSEKIIDTFEDSMRYNPFFQEEISYKSMTEQEDFLEKFTPYIETYGNYMDYKTIMSIKEGLETYQESSMWSKGIMEDFYNTFLTSIMKEDISYEGIYSAYATSVIKYYFGYGTILNFDNCYSVFEEIFDILPRETVSQYVLTNNISSLITLLKETYCLEDDAILNEMVELFNKANSANVSPEEYKEYITRLKEIKCTLMRNKLEKDPNFATTLQGRQALKLLDELSKNPEARETDSLKLNYDGTFNIRYLSKNYESIYLSNIYFCSKDTKKTDCELKSTFVINYLTKTLYSEDEFYLHIWNLLSYIIDFSNQEQIEQTGIAETIYQGLSPYFNSKEEIDEFIIALSNGNAEAAKKYFSIFVIKCKNETDPLKALAESKSLQAYYNTKVFYHHYNDYYLDLDEGFIPEDPNFIDKNSEQAKSILFIEDYFFGDVDPDPYFNEISEDIASRTAYFYDSDETIYKTRDWKTGIREYRTNYNIDIYTPKVSPKTTFINNKHCVYYVVPEGLPSVNAVITFLNLDNNLTEIPVSGLSTTIYNPETGLNERILIIYCEDEPPKEPFKPVQFKTDLFELEQIYDKFQQDNSTFKYNLTYSRPKNVNNS